MSGSDNNILFLSIDKHLSYASISLFQADRTNIYFWKRSSFQWPENNWKPTRLSPVLSDELFFARYISYLSDSCGHTIAMANTKNLAEVRAWKNRISSFGAYLNNGSF